ncbi:permease-like cell division protein FtsX [Absiella sp. AM29-15]|uniref:permease-like cell division protein FtsX n=1 Tax=Absiella sp. AM29-15 TaxID=2292278 RepID=UPI000E4241D6|nr:permease-like cell division protein FtsX [Absiella sp. AM29-15]RGC53317.1 ABC transporter permease [Absiella sp. AM29-15]
MIRGIKNLPHHFLTALKGLGRHFAMTLSSVSAVTVTLVLIALFILLAGNVNNFAVNVESSLKIRVSIDQIKTDKEIEAMQKTIKNMQGVKQIDFSSKEDELAMLIDESGSVFKRYEDNNPMPNVFIVEVNQASDIPVITKKLNEMEGIEKAQYGGEQIDNMIEIFDTLRTGGAVFVLALSLLAVFLISNTIKMTIYTRNTEISIMRNVGATNGYIKTPFMFEGMLIGMIGAVIPILIVCVGYAVLYDSMHGAFLSSMFVLEKPFPFTMYISLMLLGCGAVVGILGSFFAVTKYLRWRR